MADTREKLDVHGRLMGLLQRAPYISCADTDRQYAVNWLMNNGVTVQKWIPVTERLPEAAGCYIVTACDEGCSYGEGIWYDTVVVVAEYYEGSWSWN